MKIGYKFKSVQSRIRKKTLRAFRCDQSWAKRYQQLETRQTERRFGRIPITAKKQHSISVPLQATLYKVVMLVNIHFLGCLKNCS